MAVPDNATSIQRTSSNMDSGRKWAIAGAGAVATFVVTAVFRAQSFLIVDIMEGYETTTAEVSFIVTCSGIGGTLSALLFMFGIGDIFHERALILIAGLLNSVGLTVIYLSTRVAQTFLLGFCSGIATQIGFVCTLALTGKYFRKRLGLGTGLAVSGACFANLVIPVFYQWLKDEYTYRGSALIMAAISLNMFVSAALMRPQRPPTKRRERSMEVFRIRVESPAFTQNESREQRPVKLLSITNLSKTKYVLAKETTSELTEIRSVSSTAAETICDREGLRKRGKDLVCQKTMKSFKDFVIKPTWRKTVQTSALKSIVYSFSFFTSPRFILFQMSVFISSIGVSFLFQFYPAISRDIGMNGYQTALLLFFTGLADLFGRIFFGFLGDCNILQRYKLFAIPQYLACCGCFLSTFSTEFWAQTIFAVVIGINNSVVFSFRSPTLVELFGLPTLSRRLGVSSFIYVVGSLTAGAMFGHIRDAAGSYVLPLHITGAMFFVSASSLLAIRLTTIRCCHRREQ